MKNLILKILPTSFGKRAAVLISCLAFATVIINLVIISYIEYNSSFKGVQSYVNAQYEMISSDISDAIITDDIFSLYSTIEGVAKATPYIENIVVCDANDNYISDAKVTLSKKPISENIINISKKITAGGRTVGAIYFHISKDAIIGKLSRNIFKLFIINFIIIIAGTFVGVYLMGKMTRPLLDLSSQIKNLDVMELPYKFNLSRFSSAETEQLKNVIENLSIKLKNSFDTIHDQQKQLMKSERLAYIGTMSAGLAHELKNPIMSINLILSNFAEEVAENKQWQQDFVIIRKEADKLVFRINEFLEYSRPVKLNYVICGKDELIEYIKGNLSSLNSSNLDLKFSYDNDSVVNTDFEKISQIIEILANNSSMAGASEMNITISSDEKILTVTIADNGCGFKGADLSKILLPFYTTKKDGSGLGLAICATITDAMNGEIKAYENDPQGAVFKLTLPMPSVEI